jgi:quercetin dioxygenase-like cupin family protein
MKEGIYHGSAAPPRRHRPRSFRPRHRQDRRDREEPRFIAAGRNLLRRLDEPRLPVDNTGGEEAGLRQSGTTLDNGTVFRILELAPGASPRNHRTDSIDYAVVMSGEIDMELDGSTVHLKAGDVLVQRGTIHNWVNRGTVPCVIAFVLISAKPVEVGGKVLHAQG